MLCLMGFSYTSRIQITNFQILDFRFPKRMIHKCSNSFLTRFYSLRVNFYSLLICYRFDSLFIISSPDVLEAQSVLLNIIQPLSRATTRVFNFKIKNKQLCHLFIKKVRGFFFFFFKEQIDFHLISQITTHIFH